MLRDLMLHTREALDARQRRALLDHLADQLQVGADVHESGKPHLLFVATDPARVPPHRVLAAVRGRGYDARLVDL